jgi:hypothetical protein
MLVVPVRRIDVRLSAMQPVVALTAFPTVRPKELGR